MPWPLYPGESVLDVHWIEGWVGPRIGMDTVEKINIFFLYQESNPFSPALSPSLY
jgi:hypothetical protein